MKIYISGKITGLPIQEAQNNFEAAEKRLKSEGHEPINPMKLPHEHGKTWSEYMKEDIKALLECDAIYMLLGWQESKGACIEFNLAHDLRLKIIEQ